LTDENGNIMIQHDETFTMLAQGFIVKAKRKQLRTLKDMSDYNVAKNTTSEINVKVLEIQNFKTSNHLISVMTFSTWKIIISYC
jgi:hypothetical protein